MFRNGVAVVKVGDDGVSIRRGAQLRRPSLLKTRVGFAAGTPATPCCGAPLLVPLVLMLCCRARIRFGDRRAHVTGTTMPPHRAASVQVRTLVARLVILAAASSGAAGLMSACAESETRYDSTSDPSSDGGTAESP